MRTAKVLFISLLILFIFKRTYAAKDVLAGDIKALAEARVEAAIKRGWTEVSGISLSQLLSDIKRIPVAVLPPNLIVMVDLRRSASWSTKHGGIFVNRAAWKSLKPQARAGIALHEHLMFEGWPDNDYQLSLRLELMAETAPDRGNYLQLASRGGSATGVGGGGDGFDYLAKLGLFNFFSQKIDQGEIATNEPDLVKAALLDLEVQFLQPGALQRDVQVVTTESGVLLVLPDNWRTEVPISRLRDAVMRATLIQATRR